MWSKSEGRKRTSCEHPKREVDLGKEPHMQSLKGVALPLLSAVLGLSRILQYIIMTTRGQACTTGEFSAMGTPSQAPTMHRAGDLWSRLWVLSERQNT